MPVLFCRHIQRRLYLPPLPRQLPKFSCQKFRILFRCLQTVIHSLFNARPGRGGEVAVKRIISEYFVSGGLFHIRRKRV